MLPRNVLKLRPFRALWYKSFHASTSRWESAPPICHAYSFLKRNISGSIPSECNRWGIWEPGLPKEAKTNNMNIKMSIMSLTSPYMFSNIIQQLLNKNKVPESGGISKLPRSFLTEGIWVHQLLKSSKDIASSAHPSSCFEKVAAFKNALTMSWCELDPTSESLMLNRLLKIAIRTDSKSDLHA